MNEHDSTLLRDTGMLRLAGADAAGFLRNQLTNDVLRLGPDRHFLAGWCDAKGRTQMITQVVATADAWLLLLPRDILAATKKRLTMFVLRSDVEIEDISDQYQLIGHVGHPEAPDVGVTVSDETAWHIGLASGENMPRRSITIEPAGSAAANETEPDNWELARIDAGVPEIVTATQGQFVPQMLNLHWLQAIDFDKGCYPGQEVIARLHYRGRLTRRVFRARCIGTPPEPGVDLLDDAGQRCGTVLQAAPAGDETSRLLAVLAVDRIGQPLRLADEREIELLDLPYPTPD